MERSVIGIDVAKDSLDVFMISGMQQAYKQFTNDLSGYRHLVAWLKHKLVGQVHACLEATGQYSDGVAQYLYEQGLAVSVINPARIKAYGRSKLQRNKTDKADAELIARFCVEQNPALWTPPPPHFKELQALVRRLDDLQINVAQEQNRLQSGTQSQTVIAGLKTHIAFLEEQIELVKQAIQEHINQYPELKKQQELLVSIPGVGKLTAAKLLGEVRNITDFENARQLAAYAGLTPRNFFSGSSVRKKSVLSKAGNANLRKLLYMPAISAKRWNPIIKAFCERLLASGHKPMEVIAAAMRKLLHLAYGILKSGRPFDPDYLVKVQAFS
jgi:transposase